jgi:hypothetical protein
MTKKQQLQLNQIRNHLLIFGSITSWQAIQKYKITRLSGYILLLRKDEGFDIDTIYKRNADNTGNYGLYILTEKNFKIFS